LRFHQWLAASGKLSRLSGALPSAYAKGLNFSRSSVFMKSKPRSRQLNLLRAHRKRSAFSQDEIAFLSGALKGSKVSRHEQMTREPKLKAALAYEVIFDRPVAELFPALFEKIKASVQKRARILAKRALQGSSKALLAQKQKSVANIISQQKQKGDEKQKRK
jgi:hypothetical protein